MLVAIHKLKYYNKFSFWVSTKIIIIVLGVIFDNFLQLLTEHRDGYEYLS